MLSRLLLSRLSLTRRLSLFFTLVATSVVLGLGGLFMTAADRHFIELDRSVLQDKRHLIDDILASANSAEDLRWRLSEALNHHHGAGFADCGDWHVFVHELVWFYRQHDDPHGLVAVHWLAD